MFFYKHLRTLKALCFVFTLLASLNVIATYLSLKLLTIEFNEMYCIRVAIYTKCSVILYTIGLFGSHVLREIIAQTTDQCASYVTWQFALYVIDAGCNVSMYTQPIACSTVMLYGHYTQKWWCRSSRSTVHEETLATVAVEGEPVVPVVVGRTVSNERLNSLERLVLQMLQEPIPNSLPSITLARAQRPTRPTQRV